MATKIKLSGNEVDVFSRYARRYICMSPNFKRWVKRHFNRRVRHKEKIDAGRLRRELV